MLSPRTNLKQDYFILHVFYSPLKGWKKFARLLPNNWLAETPQPFTGEEAWQTVGGKGADFWNQLERNFKKNCRLGHIPKQA
ncbi:hypothetical protein KEH51_02255 [[Brevibacterium] frigoritolerans]|uniref:Uncharacterized protein n=1 Tax=Peribacillus frigoritolerans TaxID=450367 RepID=A0A941FJL1_9BACI|nr:hypothetical protein [Peribacillus frigoritolerans]